MKMRPRNKAKGSRGWIPIPCKAARWTSEQCFEAGEASHAVEIIEGRIHGTGKRRKARKHAISRSTAPAPKEPLNKYQIQENRPSGPKARVDYADFSGTAEAVPFQNRSYSELS
jgi:hypothetical protein